MPVSRERMATLRRKPLLPHAPYGPPFCPAIDGQLLDEELGQLPPAGLWSANGHEVRGRDDLSSGRTSGNSGTSLNLHSRPKDFSFGRTSGSSGATFVPDERRSDLLFSRTNDHSGTSSTL